MYRIRPYYHDVNHPQEQEQMYVQDIGMYKLKSVYGEQKWDIDLSGISYPAQFGHGLNTHNHQSQSELVNGIQSLSLSGENKPVNHLLDISLLKELNVEDKERMGMALNDLLTRQELLMARINRVEDEINVYKSKVGANIE